MKPSPRALALLALACLALASGQATSRAQPQEPSLPLDARHVMPLVDTAIQINPPRYGQTDPPDLTAFAALPRDSAAYPWDLEAFDDRVLFHVLWVDEDRQFRGPKIPWKDALKEPASRYPLKFRLSRSAACGRPLLLAIDAAGQAIERARPMKAYEKAAFHSDPNQLGELPRKEREDPDGFRAIHYAVANGNLPALEALLQRRLPRVKAEGPYGMKPLMLAAANGRTEAAKRLLSRKRFWRGLDPSRPGPKRATPLMRAAALRKPDILETLIRAEAAWNSQSPDSDIALARAVQLDAPLTLKAAFEAGLPRDRRLFDEIPLRWLAEFAQAEATLAYLSPGPDSPESAFEISDAAEAEAPPRLKDAPRKAYPRPIPENILESKFVVEAVVAPDGRLAAHVIRGELPEDLHAFASRWLDTFLFEPARVDGEAAACRMKFYLPLRSLALGS